MLTREVKLWDKLGALKTILEYFKDAPPPAVQPRTVSNVQFNADKLMLAQRAPIPSE